MKKPLDLPIDVGFSYQTSDGYGDYQTVYLSVWKSSPGTGKRLRPDQDWTAKDQKIERPEKTRTGKDR